MVASLYAVDECNISKVARFKSDRFVFFIVVDGHLVLSKNKGVASGLPDFVSVLRPVGCSLRYRCGGDSEGGRGVETGEEL